MTTFVLPGDHVMLAQSDSPLCATRQPVVTVDPTAAAFGEKITLLLLLFNLLLFNTVLTRVLFVLWLGLELNVKTKLV